MDRDAMIGHSVDLLVPEEIRGRHVGLRGLFATEGRTREMGVGTALEAVRADGTRFPVEISLSPIETESGTVVFVAVRDITDRRESERALHKSQKVSRLLQESLDSFSDDVILYDREEPVVFSNDAYHRIYPAAPPKEEIVGQTMEALLRSTIAASQAASPLALSDPEAWLRQSLAERRNPEGGSGESVHTNGRINSVIFVKNLEGQHIIVNSVYERATGIPASEVIGKTDHDFMPREVAEKIAERDAEIIRDGRMETFEEEVPSRDGGTRHYLTTKAPMKDENGVVFGMRGIAIDITDLKAFQRELIEATAVAEEAAMAKSAFLATMSHEIRTPMNGVVTMAEILDQTRLTADRREMTRTIRQSADALLTIINDILDFSKLEAGQLAIESLSFDLLDQIEGVADLIAPRAEAAGLRLTIDLEEGLPAQVRGDPGRLRQILLNLAGNAVKFTESGGVAVRIGHGSGGPCRIRVEIEDTGIGMSEEQVDRLFQPFSQAESSTARRFGGTGLGLTICKRLSDLMDGDIEVESTPGRGSIFRVELPLPADGESVIGSPHDLSEARVILAGYPTLEGASIEIAALEAVLRGHVPKAFDLRRAEAAQEASAPPEADDAPANERSCRELLTGVDPDIYDPDALNDAFVVVDDQHRNGFREVVHGPSPGSRFRNPTAPPTRARAIELESDRAPGMSSR